MISVAQKVIRNSVGVGLDVGGIAICGPAWPFFKKVLSPVVEELEKKYPQMFLSVEEAKKSADTILENAKFAEMICSGFDYEFKKLEKGQDEILAVLMRQGKNLQKISEVIAQMDKNSALEFDKLHIKIDQITEALLQSPVQPKLSVPEILEEVSGLQSDAMKWIQARKPGTARRRLVEARALIADGIIRKPDEPDLIALRGFIEKTQIQISGLEGDQDAAFFALDDAAKYFSAALKLESTNISALNGMVNIFIFVKDYESAANLGRHLVRVAPTYGAALWDFAIALEKKKKPDKRDPKLIQELVDTYNKLQQLIPKQVDFTAGDLDYVQRRLNELETSVK